MIFSENRHPLFRITLLRRLRRRYRLTGVPMKSRLPTSTPLWCRMSVSRAPSSAKLVSVLANASGSAPVRRAVALTAGSVAALAYDIVWE